MQKNIENYFISPRATTSKFSNSPNGQLVDRNGLKIGTKRMRKAKNRHFSQTILNVGQKSMGLTNCVKCGMVYNASDPEDVECHVSFHNRFTEIRNFRVNVNQLDSWKRSLYYEHTSDPVNGFIFLYKEGLCETLRRRLDEIILNYVNAELGFCDDSSIWDKSKKRTALIFIAESGNNNFFIAGILLMELITKATLMPQKKVFEGKFIGVERIWVHAQIRRQKVATTLLELARKLFSTEKNVLPRSRLAFEDPNDEGIQLARNYIGDKANSSYIVYTYEQDKT